MPMRNQGRAKLVEEAGEVLQICGKMDQYPDQDIHPDGFPLRPRLIDELADLAAAGEFVIDKMALTTEEVKQFTDRFNEKFDLFCSWDTEER